MISRVENSQTPRRSGCEAGSPMFLNAFSARAGALNLSKICELLSGGRGEMSFGQFQMFVTSQSSYTFQIDTVGFRANGTAKSVNLSVQQTR